MVSVFAKISAVREVAAHHLLSLAVRDVVFTVLAVGLEGSRLTHLTTLGLSVLSIDCALSVTTIFSVDHLLLFVVDALAFVLIELWSMCVVSENLFKN